MISRLPGVAAKLADALAPYAGVSVHSDHLEALDTAGALTISKAIGARLAGDIFQGQDAFADLYRLVSGRLQELQEAEDGAVTMRRDIWAHPAFFFMVWIGRLLARFLRGFVAQAGFMGHIITQILVSLSRPHKMRTAALVNVMQRAGIDAIPIVALTSFFLGGVIAFIGVLQLQQYGGGIFAIDMVCFMGLREFAPLDHRRAAGRPQRLGFRRRSRRHEDEPGNRRHARDGHRPL
ncbi:MAG: ABC transporter permease [Asticcacaulis sp.]